MTAPTTTPLAYSRREAADACRMSVEKIDQAIRSGRLKAKRPRGRDGQPGKTVVIPAAALQAWLDSEPDA